MITMMKKGRMIWAAHVAVMGRRSLERADDMGNACGCDGEKITRKV
jgi:hypothetical protein